jgi:hypothetical protein
MAQCFIRFNILTTKIKNSLAYDYASTNEIDGSYLLQLNPYRLMIGGLRYSINLMGFK